MCALLIVTACGGLSTVKSDDYKTAVKDNDFEKAHDILAELYGHYEEVWNENFPKLNYTNDELRSEVEVAATDYARAASYIYCAEVRYLVSENPDIALERIEYLFNEMESLGEKLPEGTRFDLGPGGDKKEFQTCIKFDCYKQQVKYNNEVCNIVLNLAFRNKNKELADIALSHFLDNGVLENWGDDNKIGYSPIDKQEALKKYTTAFGEE